jgi:hypothetical protein
MKKLYFLNEEESKRILNLHKEATKKQYLKEDDTMMSSENELAEDGVMASMATGAAIGGAVGLVPGAIIGGAIGLINGLINGGNYSYKGAEKILQACGNLKEVGKSTLSRATLNGIADGINAAVDGMGTDEDAIKSNLQKITTIPDLCAMSNIYNTRHGESLFAAIDGDIDSEGEWKQYVFLPLLDAYENSVDLGKKLAAQKESSVVKGFEKFPCIPSNPKAKSSKLSDGSIAYIIDGVVYYGNGRKKLVDGTMANYSCGKESSNTKTNTKTKVKQPTIPSDTDLDMVLTKL